MSKSFHDLFLEFAARRDLSNQAIATMWEKSEGEPLAQGQRVILQTLFMIENMEDVTEDNEVIDEVVYDSNHSDANAPKIFQVLA